MPLRRRLPPQVFITAGLLGIALFLIARQNQLPIVATNDFAQGLWCGGCIGLEIIGVISLYKRKAKHAS